MSERSYMFFDILNRFWADFGPILVVDLGGLGKELGSETPKIEFPVIDSLFSDPRMFCCSADNRFPRTSVLG